MPAEAEPEAVRKALASPDQPYPRAAALSALHRQRVFSSESQLLKRNTGEHGERGVNNSTGCYFQASAPKSPVW